MGKYKVNFLLALSHFERYLFLCVGAYRNENWWGNHVPHGLCQTSLSPRCYFTQPLTFYQREVKISKALTGICRHRHGSGERLMMLEGGYFSVEEILNTTRFKQMSVTREEVEDIVRNNDKQRFSLKDLDGNLLICANQGHSFEVL